MKLIVAGSRTVDKYRALYEFLKWNIDSLDIVPSNTELVSGMCPRGADQVPYLLKRLSGVVPDPSMIIHEFPAKWDVHGKAAGHIRNKEMADFADALLLIWDGKSPGSKNMKQNMEKLGKKVWEIVV